MGERRSQFGIGAGECPTAGGLQWIRLADVRIAAKKSNPESVKRCSGCALVKAGAYSHRRRSQGGPASDYFEVHHW